MSKVCRQKYKPSRRLGVAIWGDERDSFTKRNSRPGEHGSNNFRRNSDYGMHLISKQRLKCYYGRITEKQFKSFFTLASRQKGNTGENFLSLMETRLDSFVYRAGYAMSIFSARQHVSHKHFKVNGQIVNIPSFRLKVGDKVSLVDKAIQMPVILGSLQKCSESIPDYIYFNQSSNESYFKYIPKIDQVKYNFDHDIQSIVEFYSR